MSSRPSEQWVESKCRPGAASNTCRYLLADGDGWQCGKWIPEIRNQIQRRINAGAMNAQGDNCEGLKGP
jgi:hypothetical protein